MTEDPQPRERLSFDAQELMDRYPPRFYDSNKLVVYALSCPAGAQYRGTIEYTHWDAMSWPDRVDTAAAVGIARARPGFFDYAPPKDPSMSVEWHVNFSDPNLFAAYKSGLFAQDEMQVTEHPALGAVREALTAKGLAARTVEADEPAPVLLMGVERRCFVDTYRNEAEGRPRGLYGNAFAAASSDVVAHATTVLNPPTVTNLIAIAAPRPGHGTYTREQISYALSAAYTGYRAARLESVRVTGSEDPAVEVHTGFWGCGAFGGDRVLMVALQIVAAGMAGLSSVVFHTGADADDVLPAAQDALGELGHEDPMPVGALVDALVDMGFKWGVSDGN